MIRFFIVALTLEWGCAALADCSLPDSVKETYKKASAFQQKCGSLFSQSPKRMVINSYDPKTKSQRMYLVSTEGGSCIESAPVGVGRGSRDFKPGCSAKSDRSPPGYFRLSAHSGGIGSSLEGSAYFAQSLQGQGTGCDRDGDESCILLHRDRKAPAGQPSSRGCSTLNGEDWERLSKKKLFEPGMMMVNDFGGSQAEGCEGYKKMSESGECRPGKKGNADKTDTSAGSVIKGGEQ